MKKGSVADEFHVRGMRVRNGASRSKYVNGLYRGLAIVVVTPHFEEIDWEWR